MKVSIKSFDVAMDVKTKGIEFEVYGNDDKFKGDCIVTKTGLIWCKGKTGRDKGIKISWDKFMTWAEAK